MPAGPLQCGQPPAAAGWPRPADDRISGSRRRYPWCGSARSKTRPC